MKKDEKKAYLEDYIPVQDEATGNWCVQMGYGLDNMK